LTDHGSLESVGPIHVSNAFSLLSGGRLDRDRPGRADRLLLLVKQLLQFADFSLEFIHLLLGREIRRLSHGDRINVLMILSDVGVRRLPVGGE
jgi:hypothetical protein